MATAERPDLLLGTVNLRRDADVHVGEYSDVYVVTAGV